MPHRFCDKWMKAKKGFNTGKWLLFFKFHLLCIFVLWVKMGWQQVKTSPCFQLHDMFLKINSKNNKQMNRAVVLEVIADGKQTVWSPVSEFFGGGVYARPVKIFKLEVTPMAGWYQTGSCLTNHQQRLLSKIMGWSLSTQNWRLRLKIIIGIIFHVFPCCLAWRNAIEGPAF